MGWLRLVGSLKLYVSFAKEPYKRDYSAKETSILRSLLLVATPYLAVSFLKSASNLRLLCVLQCVLQRVAACHSVSWMVLRWAQLSFHKSATNCRAFMHRKRSPRAFTTVQNAVTHCRARHHAATMRLRRLTRKEVSLFKYMHAKKDICKHVCIYTHIICIHAYVHAPIYTHISEFTCMYTYTC